MKPNRIGGIRRVGDGTTVIPPSVARHVPHPSPVCTAQFGPTPSAASVDDDPRPACKPPVPAAPSATRDRVSGPDDDEDVRADGARLSEAALAQDWARPEEDDAWAPLQPAT